jgi:ElaB/YqjD/DUF883 family membrane-anchored ribosome-binding protein
MKIENYEQQDDPGKPDDLSNQEALNYLDNLVDPDDLDDSDYLDGLEDLVEKEKPTDPGDIEKQTLKEAAKEAAKWHTNAIYAGFKREMEDDPNGKQIVIKREEPLTIKPLEPDAIVIPNDGVKLNYNIGKVFRSNNVVEIKSESESFTVRAFHKLVSETYLYAAIKSIPMETVTATAIVTRHPYQVLRYIRERPSSFGVKKISDGIIHIQTGETLVQLVMCKKLTYEENLWLKAYAEVEPDRGACATIMAKSLHDDGEMSAYMHLFMQKEAVMKYFKEGLEMSVADKNKLMEKYGYVAKEEYEDALKKMDDDLKKVFDDLKKKDDDLKKKDDVILRMRMKLENAGLIDEFELQ